MDAFHQQKFPTIRYIVGLLIRIDIDSNALKLLTQPNTS